MSRPKTLCLVRCYDHDRARQIANGVFLEEWTYHLLTLAPPTVLDITSPTSPKAHNFAHARTKGYTDWTPPAISRATFLKEAVSRVYRERVAKERSSPAPTCPKAKITALSANTTGNVNQGEIPVDDSVAACWRRARLAAEIRAKRNDPNFKALPPSEDRPMSEWTTVLAALDADAPPVPHPLMDKPYHRGTPSECDTAKQLVSAFVVPAGPQVRDPVDLAVERLVGMGFEAGKAKKALAETDTGNSINFDDALESLVRERKRDVSCMMHVGYRGKAEDRDGLLRAQQCREAQLEHERLMVLGMEEGGVSPLLGAYGGGGGGGVGLGIGGVVAQERFGY